MEDWAEIRRLHRGKGMAIRAIARRLKISKNTVKKALGSHEPPRYERAVRGSIVDAVEPKIRALLAEFPKMPSTVIMERVGWERGKTVFFERVQQLRPLFTPANPASRTEYQPGELVQCDLWFPPADVPLGFGQSGRPPVLVMVSGYSRMITAVMLSSRQSPDLLAGHWMLISAWGRAPKALVWDNESAIGQWCSGKPLLTEPVSAFRGTLGIKVIQCCPGDPEAKGLVERANQRQHRRLGCRPVDRWSADRSAMLTLPPVEPVTGWRLSTRLPRDHYVRLDSNDYSVHPSAVGRRVQVTADPGEVVVTCDNTEVTRHPHCWADHQSVTDPVHATAAAQMRQARRLVAVAKSDTTVEHRALADYGRMFGLAGSEEGIA